MNRAIIERIGANADDQGFLEFLAIDCNLEPQDILNELSYALNRGGIMGDTFVNFQNANDVGEVDYGRPEVAPFFDYRGLRKL